MNDSFDLYRVVASLPRMFDIRLGESGQFAAALIKPPDVRALGAELGVSLHTPGILVSAENP